MDWLPDNVAAPGAKADEVPKIYSMLRLTRPSMSISVCTGLGAEHLRYLFTQHRLTSVEMRWRYRSATAIWILPDHRIRENSRIVIGFLQ
jgi:hypothetical protein